MTGGRPRPQRQLTLLQEQLTHALYKDVPHLDAALLLRARNAVKSSENNNDFLEFLGDRVVNLAIAVIVETVSTCTIHHSAVRRVLCNNDTFGRICFRLKLHERAVLNPYDRSQVDSYNPLLSTSPPKVCADLFEAYVGAVWTQHGWSRVVRWLKILFDPLIKAATGDFWFSPNPSYGIFVQEPLYDQKGIQQSLLDLLARRDEVDFISSFGRKAVDTGLPKSTKFSFLRRSGEMDEPDCERLEIASQLINLWICDISLSLWPQYENSVDKFPHLVSSITRVIVGDFMMSYLGSLCRLFSHFAEINKYAPRSEWNFRLSRAMFATVGWFYHADPQAAWRWGVAWLRPVVRAAHDILVRQVRYRPIISSRPSTPVESSRKEEMDEPDELLESLIKGVSKLNVAEGKAVGGTGVVEKPPVEEISFSSQSVPAQSLPTEKPLDKARWKPVRSFSEPPNVPPDRNEPPTTTPVPKSEPNSPGKAVSPPVSGSEIVEHGSSSTGKSASGGWTSKWRPLQPAKDGGAENLVSLASYLEETGPSIPTVEKPASKWRPLQPARDGETKENCASSLNEHSGPKTSGDKSMSKSAAENSSISPSIAPPPTEPSADKPGSKWRPLEPAKDRLTSRGTDSIVPAGNPA